MVHLLPKNFKSEKRRDLGGHGAPNDQQSPQHELLRGTGLLSNRVTGQPSHEPPQELPPLPGRQAQRQETQPLVVPTADAPAASSSEQPGHGTRAAETS